MSKQPNVELPIVTAEHSLGKSTAVKRKRGRPKKQTEASFGRSEELPDMCAEHGLWKSSDVERKRIRLGEVHTLQQLLTKGVGWFTIKPSVTIVALGRRRYSYHSCVECGKKGLRDAEGKYGCVEHPEAETNKPTACEFYYDKEILTCGPLLSTRSRSQFWVFLSKSSALSTTTEGRELLGE